MKEREKEFGFTDEEIAREMKRREGLSIEFEKTKKAIFSKLTTAEIKWLKKHTRGL